MPPNSLEGNGYASYNLDWIQTVYNIHCYSVYLARHFSNITNISCSKKNDFKHSTGSCPNRSLIHVNLTQIELNLENVTLCKTILPSLNHKIFLVRKPNPRYCPPFILRKFCLGIGRDGKF